MSKVYLPLGHAQRLVILVASLRKVASGELAATEDLVTRASNLEKWMGEQIAKTPSEDSLRDKVNSLRPEWQAFPKFDAGEEHHFRFLADDFARLTDAEWQVMREYLAYKPRGGETLFQVERRDWFLRNPKETLLKAKSWGRVNRKTSGFHTLQAVKNAEKGEGAYPADADVKALCKELFAPFHDQPEQVETCEQPINNSVDA
jgi:hypothetical protein